MEGKEVPVQLQGRTWLAEGPDGWEAGVIGGKYIDLGASEVGLVSDGKWILSGVLDAKDGTTLLIRDTSLGEPGRINLGPLAPGAVSLSDDVAFVSGFTLRDSMDPGILEVNLVDLTMRRLLEPSNTSGVRYLAVSADGSTLVSVLCDISKEPEPKTCDLTTISLATGEASAAKPFAGGLLRGASTTSAVIAPLGPEAPTWIAGIDLGSGREIWRETGAEFGPSYVSSANGLIQSKIVLGKGSPQLLIEAIDVNTGSIRVLYQEEGLELRSMWPELSSDALVAVGAGSGFGRALVDSAEPAQVLLMDIATGMTTPAQFSVKELAR
jgi:hypothetical protein